MLCGPEQILQKRVYIFLQSLYIACLQSNVSRLLVLQDQTSHFEMYNCNHVRDLLSSLPKYVDETQPVMILWKAAEFELMPIFWRSLAV